MPEMMKSGITTYAVSFRGHVRDPLPVSRLRAVFAAKDWWNLHD